MVPKAVNKKLSWGPVEAVLGTLFLFFGGQILAVVGIMAALLLAGWSSVRIDDWFGSGNVAQFVTSVSVAIVTLTLLFGYLWRIRAHPEDIGLTKPRLNDITYTLLGAGVYILAYLALVSVLAALIPALNTEQTQDLGFSTDTVGNGLLLVFISLVVLPPLVEEIVARGFLFTGLRSRLDFFQAAVVSSSLFGLAHLLGGEGGTTIWIATIDTFILGMVLAYLREKTGRLWAPIGLHTAKNLTAFLFLFVFKIA